MRRWMSLIIVLFAVCTAGFFGYQKTEETGKEQQAENAAEEKKTEEKKEKIVEIKEETPEDAVYSYLQGVKSYEKKEEWSGSWCYEEAGGQQFGRFGCGLCSLANIYSTLGKEACTPLEMYEHAQEITRYNPHSGVGAIGWDCIRIVLEQSGFVCELGRKPEDYETFQELAREGECLLVLVSSDNDDTYWQDTPGHYVTIWHYNEKRDEVFLADSSGPSKNRQWIPLRYVYDALKTDNPQQYLMVKGYNADLDGWYR